MNFLIALISLIIILNLCSQVVFGQLTFNELKFVTNFCLMMVE